MSEQQGDHVEEDQLHPETLMMSYGYRPEWSEGAVKPPIFATSTFVFKTAEEGKRFFEIAYGLREATPDQGKGLIYSRINHPGLEILEGRLCLWDEADSCCVFESGMAAITTTLLAHLKPGDVLLHSEPLYGGTDHFIHHVLLRYGIQAVGIPSGASPALVLNEEMAARVAMIYLETPANPTNTLVDIERCARLARELSSPERRVLVTVDNTFLGPLWQHPLAHGADLVLYSATKYIGGHSDLVAGACLGTAEAIGPVRAMRTFLGSAAGPWTCWLLLRSLETLKIRMTSQMEGARQVADHLATHPKVERVYYLGHLKEGDADYATYRAQCLSPGAMISFDVRGGEADAFRFLNALRLVKLAVSLGGTESLAQHPAAMTHCDVPPEEKVRMGISERLIRLSVGLEHPDDIIRDLDQALRQV